MSVRQLFRNVASQWFLQFIRLAIAFIVTVLVSRILGPQGYGIVSSIFVFSSVFGLALNPGFSAATIRYISVYFGSSRDYTPILSGYFLYEVLAGSSLALIFYSLSPYLSSLIGVSEYLLAFQINSLNIFLSALISVFNVYLYGVNRIDLAVLYYSISFIIGQSFSLTLVLLGLGVFGYILGSIIGSIALVSTYLIRFRGLLLKFTRVSLHDCTNGLKTIIPLGLSLFSTRITGFIYNWIDKFIVLGALGTYGLGIYSVALRFAGVFETMRGAFSTAFNPFYGLHFGAGGLDSIRNRVYSASKFVSMAFAPALMFIAPLTIYLIPLLYGESFSSAWSVASTHLLFLALSSFIVAYSSIPIILEAKKEIITQSIIVMAFSLCLESALVLLGLGALGVILGRDLSIILGFTYMYYALYKAHDLRFDAKSYLSSLVTGSIILALTIFAIYEAHILWVITAIPAILIYILMIRILKVFSAKDISLIKEILGGRFSSIVDLVEKILIPD